MQEGEGDEYEWSVRPSNAGRRMGMGVDGQQSPVIQ